MTSIMFILSSMCSLNLRIKRKIVMRCYYTTYLQVLVDCVEYIARISYVYIHIGLTCLVKINTDNNKVTGLPDCQISRLAHFPTSRLPDCQTSRLPDFQTSKLPDCQTYTLPHCQTSTHPHCQTSRLPRCQTSTLPDCQAARLPHCQTSTLPHFYAARLPHCQTVRLSDTSTLSHCRTANIQNY